MKGEGIHVHSVEGGGGVLVIIARFSGSSLGGTDGSAKYDPPLYKYCGSNMTALVICRHNSDSLWNQ